MTRIAGVPLLATVRLFVRIHMPRPQRLCRTQRPILDAQRLCVAAGLFLVLLTGALGRCQAPVPPVVFQSTLMPQPYSLVVQSGAFPIHRTLTVSFTGVRDKRLDLAVARMLRQLEEDTGIEFNNAPTDNASAAQLQIHVLHPSEAVQSIDEDESYTLSVGTQQIVLRAPSDLGALHGLETLLQLVQEQSDGYVFPAVSITDQPRFRWRGLLIDCSRHFEPVPVILRTLDGMAAEKLNVFHWHLTDDQGFRVESLRFPRLQRLGADGSYYTQRQIREVVDYARARGIRVVPEFDMPGHSTSWFVGYPHLASAPGPYHVSRKFGVHDAAMDPTRESTYRFLDAFIGEMARLFPDAYVHIGGDETDGKQWMANPRIRSFMRSHGMENAAALQVYFNQRVLRILRKYRKHMLGWDEVLVPGLPKDVVVQSWRGIESLREGARKGYQGILSAPYYLDGMQSAEDYYLADPIPAGSDFSPIQRGLILGGEACMWGEQISPQTIDSRIWPRTAAIAERFWSPAEVRDVDDMYRRLRIASLRLDALGLEHISGSLRMQRQLSASASPVQLDILTSVLEPAALGERFDLQQTEPRTPLNGLVDAVVPDPPSRHEFALTVREFLQDLPAHKRNAADLDGLFRCWKDTASKLGPLMKQSPRLAPYASQAEELGELGAFGMEALHYLHIPADEPAGWEQRSLARIATIQKERSLVHFSAVDPLKELVIAAGAAQGHPSE
jgi:hexosaminidase